MRKKQKKKKTTRSFTKAEIDKRIRILEKHLKKKTNNLAEQRRTRNELASLKRELNHRISGIRNMRITIVSSPMGGKLR